MNLKEVADLSWSQLFPEASVQSKIPKESFIRTAYSSFAYQTLLMAWRTKAEEGYFEVPSYLLTEVELPIVNNEMDISGLKYFKALPTELWLQNIGGICDCKYVKSSVNISQLLCDDDSMDDATKPYFPLGRKLVFPKGTHKTPLSIIYANMGEDLNGNIEVDEAIADLIRTRLSEIYLGKVPPADVTTQNNPDN